MSSITIHACSCIIFDTSIPIKQLSNTTVTSFDMITRLGLIGLSGNNFEGAMPQNVCDLRPSPLQTLVIDCDIECAIPECCTSCVPTLNLNNLMMPGFGGGLP
jgi:hypothetical protein